MPELEELGGLSFVYYLSPELLNTMLKGPELEQLWGTDDFWNYCLKHRHDGKIYYKLLKFVSTPAQRSLLGCVTQKQLAERTFLFAAETKYRDLSGEVQVAKCRRIQHIMGAPNINF